jgi:hypothetical protein
VLGPCDISPFIHAVFDAQVTKTRVVSSKMIRDVVVKNSKSRSGDRKERKHLEEEELPTISWSRF